MLVYSLLLKVTYNNIIKPKNMKIKNIEIYEDNGKWVVNWEEDSNLKYGSDSFPSKEQAEEFKEKLESRI